MKPIKLEIEGLKSYVLKQVIDFDTILKEGIFGVFGNTGSGKSTILDAISLALYSRTQKGKQEATDFINTNLSRASVDFTFEILHNGKRRTYRVFREFLLGKDRKPKSPNAKLYELNNSELLLIEEGSQKVNQEIEKIIGLSFDDFIKCIALPQGEFDSFIKEQRGKRLEIIARLFSLEKYGAKLFEKAKNIYINYKTLKDSETSKLEVLGEYTKEKLDLSQDILKNNTEKLSVLIEKNKKLETLYNEEKELLTKVINFKENQDKLTDLLKDENSINQLKNKLLKYKDANEILELNEELKQKTVLQEDEKKNIKRLEDELLKINSTNNLEEKNKFLANYDNIYEELNNYSIKLNSIKLLIDSRKELISNLEAKRNEYKVYVKNLEEESRKMILLSEKIKQVQTEKDNIKEQDIFNIIISKIESNALHKEYSFLLDELYKRPKNVDILWLEKLFKEKIIDNNIENVDCDIENIIETEKQNKEKKEEITKKLNELNIVMSLGKQKIINLETEKEKILNEGKEIKEKSDNIEIEIQKVLCGKDYNQEYTNNTKNINQLKQKKIKIDKENELYNSKTEEIKAKIIKAEANTENLLENLNNISIKIGQKLKKCDIIDASVANNYAMNVSEAEKAEAKVKNYDNEKNILYRNIELLKAEISDKTINQEIVQNHKTELENFSKEILDLQLANASLKTEIEKLIIKLQEKAEIEKKEKEYTKSLSLAESLMSLFKGGSFLEFVADEYLKEIAVSASSTLLELTLGHYSLLYDKEFFVIDNRNGGVSRKINTLSGGETFLVSLSLAFSLSVAIYNKSDKHIEFFFLDEGFGSLDEELINVTLDSLDKLKGKNLSIGLISHVKEMEERINSKIIVERLTESDGSKIKLIY